MQQLNHNFIRLWTWEPVTWNTKANRENKLHTSAPQPWARTGPGMALDGKPKFNLKKFNPAYFDRLRRRISAARDRGIYVSVMLFEGWAMQFSAGAWEGHPFNKQNNINNIDGDQNKDGKGLEIHWFGPKLKENRYYVIASRMGAGTGKVTIELFVNGTKPVASKLFPVNPKANSSKMAIGQERDATNHPGHGSFDGELARLLMWDRPLSNQEFEKTLSLLKKTYALSPR